MIYANGFKEGARVVFQPRDGSYYAMPGDTAVIDLSADPDFEPVYDGQAMLPIRWETSRQTNGSYFAADFRPLPGSAETLATLRAERDAALAKLYAIQKAGGWA